MTEPNKELNDANANLDDVLDPIDQELDISPPDEAGKKAKKGLPKAAKVGLGVMTAGVLVVMAFQMMVPTSEESQQQAGKINLNVSDAKSFRNAPASQVSTNPEAEALNSRVQTERAGEILKDPTKSFITADPFGNSDVGNNFEKREPRDEVADLLPPQAPPELAPPVAMTPPPRAGNGEEDPILMYARKIAASSLATPELGISAGNTAPPALIETNASMNGASQGATNKIQTADVGAGEISYAQLTSGLNSIVPQTPPRAIIRGGKLNGAILLGQMEVVDSRYLVLKFNTLMLNKKTYPIAAIAVNPEMQDAGIVDTVRDRAWTRGALQAGVGFVQAFGAAKLEEGTSSTQNQYGSTTTEVPKRSNSETAIIALGGAAQAVKGTVDQEIAKIRDEVKIEPNKEIGVLFMQPLILE